MLTSDQAFQHSVCFHFKIWNGICSAILSVSSASAAERHLMHCRYSTTTNQLTNDTTTYPAVPNLPVPICYPQTASVVMLPLEPGFGYNPRILVVGGSSSDGANPGTPATPATYLLDFSIRPFAWVREDMSSPRVMPDVTLVPDGGSLSEQGLSSPALLNHYVWP